MQFPNESKQAEQRRVDFVTQLIEQQLQETSADIDKAQHERRQVELNFGANTRANYIETDDIIETNATLQQQRQLMTSAVSNEEILQHKEKELHALEGSPYFGRIDIQEAGENDTLYIGTASLSDENGEFWVYDWRAPIASIYYNGTLGTVKYESPMGTQNVDLQRKRQFSIRQGHIDNMFDTNETIGDEILKNALGQASSAQMKNIVATIQQSQNQIIRDTKSELLIVQGAAGSGKTSTIMQRIAYLLYHSRQQLNAEQIILFSPNNLFSNYIAEVLPSLGENNMRQVTLQTFLARRLHGLKIQTLFERFEQEQTTFAVSTQQIRQYKDSIEFAQALQKYAQHADLSLAFTDLIFEGQVFFTKKQIQDIYQQLPQALASADKFLQTKNHLIKQLQHFLHEEEQADWVIDAIDNLSSSQYQAIDQQEHLEQYSSQQQQHILARYLVKQHYLPVYDAIYNDYFFDVFQLYQHFLSHLQPAAITPSIWQEMIVEISANLERHYLQLDDATAILYLQQLVTGSGQNQRIKYLFIDEMQDYSALQLAYIQNSFPNAKLTLLGDIEQNVYAHDTLSQQRFYNLTKLIPHKKSTLITLNQSYRATAAITNLAKQFIPSGAKIQAFNRSGKTPILFSGDEQKLPNFTLKLAQQQVQNQRRVAIITKTNQQAQHLAEFWGNHAQLLQEQHTKIPQGIVVLPVYLAKGLEFDSVIGYDVSTFNYHSDGDCGILYTIATRALHELFFVCGPQRAAIFNQVKPHSLIFKKF
ncbi:ATP-dependent DNA helicase [Bombilactobacillus bombi]|uniref:RNA polymerase recycling motor HelD n=1 Tax=Bombilactobacillus bombi TaxID=1303590 RepID=UPI000E584381|nr:RNA polymerase recycling motor HelD [Bombilactobacillus bombi]AXX64019.1 ATP-dependent DNA helicase [Bombilactobacillus bombi]